MTQLHSSKHLHNLNRASLSSVNDEFPTICSKCLGADKENGENQYLNFIRSTMGSECKLCNRVFTSYKFKQSSKASRYIHTEVCKTCSTMKNICQCCLLDLEYGVPYWMRESVENGRIEDQHVIGHQNELMSMYNAERMQSILDEKLRLARGQTGLQQIGYNTINEESSANATALVPLGPLELGVDQMVDLKDRKDLLKKLRQPLPQAIGFQPPEDKKIKTLYVGPFDCIIDGISENDLRINFEPYGPLRHIKIVKEKKCALVTYIYREDAEIAAETLYGNILKINDKKLNVQFVKKKTAKESEGNHSTTITRQSDLKDSMEDILPPPDPRVIALLSIPEDRRPPLPKGLSMLYPPQAFTNIPTPPSSSDMHEYPTQKMSKC